MHTRRAFWDGQSGALACFCDCLKGGFRLVQSFRYIHIQWINVNYTNCELQSQPQTLKQFVQVSSTCKNNLNIFLPQRCTLCTSLSFRDLSTHLNANTSVVVMSKHLITLSKHPVLHHTIPATNLETVCASEPPLPFSMLFLTPKCFTFVNIEWGSGVLQGIVAAVVATL